MRVSVILITALLLAGCSGTAQQNSGPAPAFTGPSKGNITSQPLTDIGGGFEATTLFGGVGNATIAIRWKNESERAAKSADRDAHFSAGRAHVISLGCGNATLTREKPGTAPKYYWNFSFKCT